MEAFTRTPGAPPRLTDNFLFNSFGWEETHPKGSEPGRLRFFPPKLREPFACLVLGRWPPASLPPPGGGWGCVLSLSISSGFHPEAYWFLMFSISLSKGLISILQHHFQDNSSDRFSRHVLPSLQGVTHFWWQWIDYKETGGECSAFWRLTRIWWGLASSLRKHHLLSFPSCPSIRNENDGHFWLNFQLVLNLNYSLLRAVSHRKFTSELCYVIKHPGGSFEFRKERPLSWETHNHRQIGTTGHPVGSSEVSWPLSSPAAIMGELVEASLRVARSLLGVTLCLLGVAVNCVLWSNTASTADSHNYRKPWGLLGCVRWMPQTVWGAKFRQPHYLAHCDQALSPTKMKHKYFSSLSAFNF